MYNTTIHSVVALIEIYTKLHKISLTPVTFNWSDCTNPGMWSIRYMFVYGYRFVCFYHLDIGYWILDIGTVPTELCVFVFHWMLCCEVQFSFDCWQNVIFYFHACQNALPSIIILHQRNKYIFLYVYILKYFECFGIVIFTSQCGKIFLLRYNF